MAFILTSFFVLSLIMTCFLLFWLYKNLPNKKEKLKFIIPLLIALAVGTFCYLLGMRAPTIEFGRFM